MSGHRREFRTIDLWVDDERPAPPEWTWVKSVEDATGVLARENVRHMSLDYDLGRGGTGDDVMYWLIKNRDRSPSGTIFTHSSNITGREVIEALVERLLQHN